MKRCMNCGTENNDYCSVCTTCGNHLFEGKANNTDTEAITRGKYALVYGILSFFCCLVIVFGPLAIIEGNKSKTGLGLAGKVLGIVSLCVWGAMVIYYLFCTLIAAFMIGFQ